MVVIGKAGEERGEMSEMRMHHLESANSPPPNLQVGTSIQKHANNLLKNTYLVTQPVSIKIIPIILNFPTIPLGTLCIRVHDKL